MKVKVRMYCHGFGDCFLITFDERVDSPQPYRILIDCGLLTGSSTPLSQVIQSIATETKGYLDVVVQTHEHKDHISGFNLKDRGGKLLWDGIRVNQVWQAWTENPKHALANKLRTQQKEKKVALDNALTMYQNAINSPAHRSMMETEYKGHEYLAAEGRYAVALSQLLEFNNVYASEPMDGTGRLTIKSAMEYFSSRAEERKTSMRYLEPGKVMKFDDTGLQDVTFYVLGPPQDEKKLRVMDDPKHEEMYLMGPGYSDNFFAALIRDGQEDDISLSPFGEKYLLKYEEKNEIANKRDPKKVQEENVLQGEKYSGKEYSDVKQDTGFVPGERDDDVNDHVISNYYKNKNSWRRIDKDWLHNTGMLALSLDSYTNNTSLVLAIGVPTPQGEKILLFPGDAQIGNWKSWTETDPDTSKPSLQFTIVDKVGTKNVTGEDLLRRTIFYKVGHHASHNATARNHGLELMKSDELVAMIPVDEKIARRQGKRGWDMPAEDLYKRLIEKTQGRIIRADNGIILETSPQDIPAGSRPTEEQVSTFMSKVSKSPETISTDEGLKRPMYFEYVVVG